MAPHLRGPLYFLLLACTAFLSSCGGVDSHDKVTRDNLALMEKAAVILEGVKDKSSAKAAAEDLEKLSEKFDKIAQRAKALGPPDPETAKALREKYGDQTGELIGRLMKASLIAATKGQDLQNVLKTISGAWKNVY